MSRTEIDVNVANSIAIRNRAGQPVSFEAVSHYDASSYFDDDVDLPAPGRLWVGEAGDISIMPINSDVALTYSLDSARELPIVVKRILSSNTTVTTAYIWN